MLMSYVYIVCIYTPGPGVYIYIYVYIYNMTAVGKLQLITSETCLLGVCTAFPGQNQ